LRKLSKGILIAIMSFSLLIAAMVTANADISDPFVHINTASTNTTSANADISDPYVHVNTTSVNTTSANNATTGCTTSANKVATGCTTSVNKVATGCAIVLNDCGYPIYDAVIYAEDVTIFVGDEFDIMNDVEAYDDDGYGEDITDQVTAYGKFNTAVPDDYYITYKVTGSNGRTVYQEIVLSVIDPALD